MNYFTLMMLLIGLKIVFAIKLTWRVRIRIEIYRLLGKDEKAQMVVVQRWMESQLADAKTIIRKPLVFTDFGK